MNRPPRLLIIDDDPQMSLMLRIVLRTLTDWQILEATSGTDGLQQSLSSPDGILLDWTLQDMFGGDVLQQLATIPRTASIPVVILTAASELVEAPAGALAVLTKPFQITGLAAALSRLFEWSTRLEKHP